MRILYFHQYFKTPQGSGSTRSYEMAKYLVDNGHRVTMVYALSDRTKSPIEDKEYIKGIRKGRVDGIDLLELNIDYSNRMGFIKRTGAFLKYALRSINIVFKEKYDLLFATTTPLTAGIPGIVMKTFGNNNPFVFEVRDLWPELPKAMGVIKNPLVLWMMEMLESLSYNKADACVALSPGIKQGIEKKLKKNKPIALIPNGCDLELFSPGSHPKSIFPDISNDCFIATFTGAHGFANGLGAALDVATVLKKRGFKDQIKFTFIGDGARKKDLQKRKEEENLENCIFIDPVAKAELPKYMQASDVGLMLLSNVPAFYYGTSPNKFFDYIACGLPVLNNYPGWLANMIEEFKMGVVVPPENAEVFADNLITLYENPSALEVMGENARSLAENKFNREELAANMEVLMKETVND